MKTITMGLLCIGMSLMGCDKDNERPAASLNNEVILSYSTANGGDLLDPDTDNHITYDNTDLYYVKDGKEERQYHSNLDFPKHFKINNDSNRNKYYLTVFLNYDVGDGEVSTNILKYENFEPDTIQAIIHKTGNNVSASDIILNGKPISDGDLDKIVVVK